MSDEMNKEALEGFEKVLSGCLSPNNELRGRAEKRLADNRKEHPDLTIRALVYLVSRSSSNPVRLMCCVLLRQHFTKDQQSTYVWPRLSASSRQWLKKELPRSLMCQEDERTRQKLADAIGELGVSLLQSEGGWPEFLPFLLHCVRSPKSGLRLCGFEMFAQLGIWLGEVLQPEFSRLRDLFRGGLGDDDVRVRISAVRALGAVLPNASDPDELALFVPLFPGIVETLGMALRAQLQREAREALEILTEIVEVEPRFVKPHLASLHATMMRIAKAPGMEDSTRKMAMEPLVALVEVKPGLARKIPKLVDDLLPILMQCMTQIEDNEDWNNGPEDDLEDENADWGGETLDRLSLGIGGRALVPVLLRLVPGYLNDKANWRRRVSGFRALLLVGEGSGKYMKPHLQRIIKELVPRGVRDPHPRVRFTVATLIGQACTDYGPALQAAFHGALLPPVAHLLDDKANPRVQSQAAGAVVNFCDKTDRSVFEPYAERMLAKAHGLLGCNNVLVMESVVTMVAAIADRLEQGFRPFYARFVPGFIAILQRYKALEHSRFRGKTLEALTLCCMAVGRKMCGADCKRIADWMLATQRDIEADKKRAAVDPLLTFFQQAWSRICAVIGADFAPYLRTVIGPVFRSASLPPDVEVYDDEVRNAKEGWEYVSLADRVVGVNTVVLQEKATGCNMLFSYVHALKEHFFPHLKHTIDIVMPLLRFYFSDEVRAAATTSLEPIVRCAALHCARASESRELVRAIANRIVPALLDALQNEIEPELRQLQIEALHEVIDAAGPGVLSEEAIKTVMAAVKVQLREIANRRHRRAQRAKEPDFDEQDAVRLEQANEADDQLLATVAEVPGKTFRQYGSAFLPMFRADLADTFLTLCKPSRREHDRQVGICIFDDVIEFCGRDAMPYVKHLLPVMLNGVGAELAGLRQAAVYGIGVSNAAAPELIAPHVPKLLAALAKIVGANHSRIMPNAYATENAISAFGRLLLAHHDALPADTFARGVVAFLQWLPVTHDDIESRVTYTVLCDMASKHAAALFGANGERAPLVLAAFANALGTKYVSPAETARIVALAHHLHQANKQSFSQAASSLTDEQQQKLKQALQTKPSTSPAASPSKDNAQRGFNATASSSNADSSF
jgi:importin-5